MCTLTFLPKSDGFTVTQNRDESPLRGHPIFPFRDQKLLYPKDPDGDGTWMLTDGEYVICVLNGGFEPHKRKLPYRHSRGLLPKIALSNPDVALAESDAQGLEPFSVFIFSSSSVRRITWNAKELIVESFDPKQPYIWQSAPLYSSSIQTTRSFWFEQWVLSYPSWRADDVLDFHIHGGEGISETNICMYRPGVQTTAITQVDISGINGTYYFQSILTEKNISVRF